MNNVEEKILKIKLLGTAPITYLLDYVEPQHISHIDNFNITLHNGIKLYIDEYDGKSICLTIENYRCKIGERCEYLRAYAIRDILRLNKYDVLCLYRRLELASAFKQHRYILTEISNILHEKENKCGTRF
jgi:hypothetical protein